MVFLELRPLAHAPQLNEGVAGVGLVLSTHDRLLIGGRDDSQLDHLRIWQKYSATRSARASSSAEKCSLISSCGVPFNPSFCRPDA